MYGEQTPVNLTFYSQGNYHLENFQTNTTRVYQSQTLTDDIFLLIEVQWIEVAYI